MKTSLRFPLLVGILTIITNFVIIWIFLELLPIPYLNEEIVIIIVWGSIFVFLSALALSRFLTNFYAFCVILVMTGWYVVHITQYEYEIITIPVLVLILLSTISGLFVGHRVFLRDPRRIHLREFYWRNAANRPLNKYYYNNFFSYCSKATGKQRIILLGLERRAASLMRISRWILVTIIGVLIVSAVFIVFAGVITRFGTYDLYAELQNSIRDKENELAEIESTIRDLRLSKIDDSGRLLSNKSKSPTEETMKETSELNISIEQKTTNISTFEEKRASLLEEKNELGSIWKSIVSKNAGNLNETRSLTIESTQEKFMAESITRFGVLIIVIFLVRILIDLYRYNTRLVAFYRSRLDTILLVDVLDKKGEAIARILEPDIGYGSAPSTLGESMMDRLADVLRTYLSRGRSRRKGKQQEDEKADGASSGGQP